MRVSFATRLLGETKAAFPIEVLDGRTNSIVRSGKVKGMTIPCLRLRHGRLARTLARQIGLINHVRSSITTVTRLARTVCRRGACGSSSTGTHWLKPLRSAPKKTCRAWATGRALIGDPGVSASGRLTAQSLVERSLRPLKLTNGALKLVIPVKPRWAQHLFDSRTNIVWCRPRLGWEPTTAQLVHWVTYLLRFGSCGMYLKTAVDVSD